MTDTTDDLAHLDARIDLIREQRDAMERIAAERAVASDRNLARWTSATDALHKATADLNATREKLTTAEAFRDSLQAEVDGLRVERDAQQADLVGLHCAAAERDTVRELHKSACAERDALRAELTSMTIMRDKAHAHLAAISASLGVESVSILATIERVRDDIKRKDREWSAMRDERDALRAELNRRLTIADDERAEFVLAAVAVAQALDDGRSLGPAGDERDPRAWVRFARELADRVKASRAEVDKLRARPVLTVDMAERVISTYCDEFAATDREGRTDVWAEVDQARRDHAIGVMKSTIDKLGAVTLPAQDAAAALWKAIDDQIVVEAEKVRDGSGVDWHSAYSGAIGTRAKAEAIVRAALASLGAPATTPPATVATLTEDRLADVLASLSTWRGERMPWHSDSTRPWASDLMGRLGVITTPSKPADVFAGVSIEELDKVQMTAEVEYAIKVGSHSDSTPACRAAGLSAVLDALRVKLVAPVDPDAVLADVFGAPHWRSFANEYRTARCVAMRATLEAKGIPVTPEAGK